MNDQSSFIDKLPSLIEHLYLKFVLLQQAIKNGQLVSEARGLATTLEESVFPPLQKIRQQKVTVLLGDDGAAILADNQQSTTIEHTKKLAHFLTQIGIETIALDTLLEKNQITNALVTIFHAGHLFSKVSRSHSTPKAYNAKNLAAIVQGNDGLNKFCANIRFDRDNKTLTLKYSYCELFYTFTVNTIIDRYTEAKNHQAIFALAPKIGGTIGILFLLHHLFWSPYSIAGVVAALFGAIALALGITYLTNTIASVLYDQEHRDKLLQENVKEITALSHIPAHNPNPIMKLSAAGVILFANHAAENQARMMAFSSELLHEILPNNYLELIKQCLERQQELFDLEVSRHGRTLRYNISPFVNENAVLISATDITRLKELEVELRLLNKNLEKKVLARTKELASTQDITILSLSSLAETRDPETGAHILRTRLYVKLLAEYLRRKPRFQKALPDDQTIDLLYRSAPLHDIGKVGIPDAILLKADKLSNEEFEIMKTHPVIGGDSLKWAAEKLGTNSFLQLAREIAYGHHEKWDGSGYPYGQAGEEIPLSCRLMALADVYDALVNKRVYKEAYSHQRAKEIIQAKKGRHFDPEIVEAFLALENEFITIAETYNEHE